MFNKIRISHGLPCEGKRNYGDSQAEERMVDEGYRKPRSVKTKFTLPRALNIGYLSREREAFVVNKETRSKLCDNYSTVSIRKGKERCR